ncbi:PilT/PilU family type 4a pilus ATPase, partial [bacterium]|nr:PilT/PilU family type 4a pilus ATPase [bacterium]
RPPLMRVDGILKPLDMEPLTRENAEQLLELLNDFQRERFEKNNSVDLSFEQSETSRFRVNIFRRRGSYGAVFRKIPIRIPNMQELFIPPIIKNILTKNQGLFLVTGPTGSGKSTTLAGLINEINQTQDLHIITIEDPIEFIFVDNRCVITQREIGIDCDSFAEALKVVLRQDPDIIVIGEIRDVETVRTAMTAAETGHLVFSTLHTNDSTQTVDRIIDIFPAEQQEQIRLQLSLVLQGVISQTLLQRKDGQGRIAAFEIMLNSPNVQRLILEGSTEALFDEIESSVSFFRMQSMNQSLIALYSYGFITKEEALSASSRTTELDQFFIKDDVASAIKLKQAEDIF